MIREEDIVHESWRAWVLRDIANRCYTVYLSGATHSTSDSSYSLDDDGLSLAQARCDYLGRRP